MVLHLMIPRNNLRIARGRRAAIARPGLCGRALLLRLVLVLLGRRSIAGAVVHVALGLGWLRVGALLRLVALRLLLLLAPAAAAAAAAVRAVDKDVDAPVLGVLRHALVVVVVGRFGVLGDDVPGVEEAGDLGKGGRFVSGGDGGGGGDGWVRRRG